MTLSRQVINTLQNFLESAPLHQPPPLATHRPLGSHTLRYIDCDRPWYSLTSSTYHYFDFEFTNIYHLVEPPHTPVDTLTPHLLSPS
ncbi:hypothetical protein M404DRAFT_997011 [Pisolithus tinctorius Marx 270]|uniref:Uncharacterized protein n=1 Tax=Pisolithus tinctorius Marx 270 TaxID=870435 RepID=A0A0C3P687_PISTI|nr:hypothetical protein M404DRAFT_997011 [Pisolithus tinctorius Marx 270]